MTVGRIIIAAAAFGILIFIGIVTAAVVASGTPHPVRCTPDGACVDAIDSPYVMRRAT